MLEVIRSTAGAMFWNGWWYGLWRKHGFAALGVQQSSLFFNLVVPFQYIRNPVRVSSSFL